jgi:hypothetical protein
MAFSGASVDAGRLTTFLDWQGFESWEFGERAGLGREHGRITQGVAAAGRAFCLVGGGALQRAPPRSGAYARQEGPGRALKTHLRS